MSTDYREKEREFLGSLKDDTGRDVREWMAAITAQNLPHRNDIIDWLRQQGFMFSKASWLERVHNNGGKPIYSDTVVARRAMPKRAPSSPAEAAAAPEISASEPEAAPHQAPTLTLVAASVPTSTSPLDELLQSAKAYRPLALHILKEIAKAVPGSAATAQGGYVSLNQGGREFAVLVIGARELRLGLALAGSPFEAPLQAARVTNPAIRLAPEITHMAIVNDVRQIDSGLMTSILKAAAG